MSVTGLLAAVLVGLALPLGIAIQSVLTSRALDELQAEVSQISFVVVDRARSLAGEVEILRLGAQRGNLGLASYTVDGRELVRVAQSGRALVPGDVVAEAVRRSVARAREDGLLKVAQLVNSPGGIGLAPDRVLYAQRSDAELSAAVRRAWAALGGILAAVLALGAVAASVLGTRLGRPLDDLATAARRLGDGDFSGRSPRSGLEEVDAIATALDTTAERLGTAVARGQAFTADASHQLRTPLTALRLHLETAEARLAGTRGDDSARASVGDALREVDRLDATIQELVSLTRVGAAEELVDLRDVAAERLAAVQARALAQGRELVLLASPSPPVVARAAAIGQALDVLVDNALEHGRGRVSVVVAPASSGAVRLAVHDQGGAMPAAVIDRVNSGAGRDRAGVRTARRVMPVRGGRGLQLARALVEAEGGRIRVDQTGGDVGPGTLVSLLVPVPATDG